MKINPINRYKPVLIPVATMIAVVVIFLIAGNIVIGKIGTLRSDISTLQDSNAILEERATTLQSVPVELTTAAQLSALALPPKTPSILVIKQLRELATIHEVSLDNVEITNRGKANEGDEMETTAIKFDVIGPYQSVADYVAALGQVLPVVNLDSLDIQQNRVQEGAVAQVELTSYAAALPETLPSLSEPIVSLNDTEQKTLTQIQSFRSPESGTEQPPAVNTGRTNPFQSPL